MALKLRPFETKDLNNFSTLHSNPKVMHDLGGPITRTEAEEKLQGYISAYHTHGYARMAVFYDADFAGYVGVMHHDGADHPLGPHDEIGWRLLPAFWGQGIAVEAARLTLSDVFGRVGLPLVLAYTGPDNLASRAVMQRLGMTRTPNLDFEETYPPVGIWQGLTWRITAQDHRGGGIE